MNKAVFLVLYLSGTIMKAAEMVIFIVIAAILFIFLAVVVTIEMALNLIKQRAIPILEIKRRA